MSLFLDNFNKMCVEKGVAPSKAAVDCGVSRQAYSHWKERDSAPSLPTLRKIADYFNVPVEYFIKDDFVLTEEKRECKQMSTNFFFTISEKLTEREYCILQLYRTLSDADKSDITEHLFRLHEKDTQ